MQAAYRELNAVSTFLSMLPRKGSAIVPLIGARTGVACRITGGLNVERSSPDVARIEEAVPASAVAGTRYDPQQMRIPDRKRQGI